MMLLTDAVVFELPISHVEIHKHRPSTAKNKSLLLHAADRRNPSPLEAWWFTS